MFSIKENFKLSSQQIKNNFGSVLLATIVMLILSGLVNFLGQSSNSLIVSIITYIAMIIVSVGYIGILMGIVKEGRVKASNSILPMRTYLRYVLFAILYYLIVVVIIAIIVIVGGIIIFGLMGSPIDASRSISLGLFGGLSPVAIVTIILLFLLVIIPIVYVSVMYTFSPFFILMNEDEIDTLVAMKQSRKMVNGSFGKLILLMLLFTLFTIVIGVPFVALLVLTMQVVSTGMIIITAVFAIIFIIGMIYMIPFYTLLLINVFVELLKKKYNASEYLIVKPENLGLIGYNSYEEVFKEQNNDVSSNETKERKEDIDSNEVSSNTEGCNSENSEVKVNLAKPENSEAEVNLEKPENSEAEVDLIKTDDSEEPKA